MSVFAKFAKGVSHVLKAAAVVGDGEIPLGEAAELGIKEENPCFSIVEKLRLDGKPANSGGGVVLHDGVGEVKGQGVHEP